MSKKTRKKSSKSAVGRAATKAGGAKAGTSKRSAAKKPGSTAAGKAPKKIASKRGVASKTKAATASKSTKPTSAAAGKSARTKKPTAGPTRLAATLNEGDRAPAFSLLRDGGEQVSLAAFTGRKLVIFFYPRADTPGCTLEAVAFSRLAAAFADAGTAVLGVSADPVKAQESFRNKHELTVPLLSDEKLGMLKAYGVWGEKSMYGKTFMGISRTTVLIDGNGKVARIWRNVKVDGHADEVLAVARAA